MDWRTKLSGEIHEAIMDEYPKDEADPGDLSDKAQRRIQRAAEAIADLWEEHPMFSECIAWDEHLQSAVEEVYNRRQAEAARILREARQEEMQERLRILQGGLVERVSLVELTPPPEAA